MQGLQLEQPGLEVDDRALKTHYHLESLGPEVSSAPSHKQSKRPPRHNPFGLSPLAFGALICVITSVLIGGAIAGSLGWMLIQCRRGGNG
jgi:hypothetical protein